MFSSGLLFFLYCFRSGSFFLTLSEGDIIFLSPDQSPDILPVVEHDKECGNHGDRHDRALCGSCVKMTQDEREAFLRDTQYRTAWINQVAKKLYDMGRKPDEPFSATR